MISPAPKKLVVEAVVANKFVVVALVPVAFTKVKFCSVVDPERSKFERLVSPAVAVRLPVKLAALEIVWPLMRPEVKTPAVRPPTFPLVAKRLVELAVVAKKLVVVALDPVALRNVKF